jgi:hypothetical protein
MVYTILELNWISNSIFELLKILVINIYFSKSKLHF